MRKGHDMVEQIGEGAARAYGLMEDAWRADPANTRIVTLADHLLLALVEPVEGEPLARSLFGSLLDAVEQACGAVGLDPVRRVAEGLTAANEWLFERNLRADARHRVLVGLQVALVQGDEAWVGQLGPAAITGSIGAQLVLHPQEAACQAEDAAADDFVPAGLARETAPSLYRVVLRPGDVLILASTDLVRATPIWDLVPALAHQDGPGASELLPFADCCEGTAVIVYTYGAGGGEPRTQPDEGAGSGGPGRVEVLLAPSPRPQPVPFATTNGPSGRAGDGLQQGASLAPTEGGAQAEVPLQTVQAEPIASEPAPSPGNADSAASDGSDDVDAGVSLAIGVPDSLAEPILDPSAGDSSADDRVADDPGAKDAPARPADRELVSGQEGALSSDGVGQPLRKALAAVRWPRMSLPRLDLRSRIDGQRLRLVWRESREGSARAARRLVITMEDALVSVLPDRVPERPPQQPRPVSLPAGGKGLVILAMAIPIVMLAMVMATRIQYDRARRGQFGDLQAAAQSQYEQSTSATDPAAARQALYDALATSEAGLALNPTDDMLLSLKRRIESKLDEITAVERVYTFYKLAELGDDASAISDASRVVVRGIDLYVLNKGSDRVHKFLTNDIGDALQYVSGDPVLLRKGDVHAGLRVSNVVDMAWLEAGGQRTIGTFMVVDRSGTMYAYDPQQGIDALPIADSQAWMKPEAVGGYFGNLYVLDPLLNAILKYVPTDNAYTTPPVPYLSPSLGTDLTGAVDMAIDGNIYVLFADGRVAKFYDGQQVPFSMEGLPSPMRSPGAIFVSGSQEPGAAGYVYVADTGNQRILQFTKDGQYVRQLRSRVGGDELRDLRGLYVDEEGERLLVVSGRSLWFARLPALSGR